MNRHCHRIVFNHRRGQLMAVAETASAGGKAASGESTSHGSQGPSSMHGRCHSSISQMVLAMWLAVGALPMALAQIIADPTAPANQRPTVLSDSTGRPLVNIQTPSAAGLSRNTYRQFDVPTSGIVLNNSASNPWLSNGVLARTILNEVNSTSQSFINGNITVNGAAAQVIVANPNGITVNGGGFINASRATLTTGTPQFINGALTGFSIRGGGVTIGAGGLNNSATPYTDIMSRAVTLTGALRAQNLGITTGLQTVANDTGLISNQDTNTYAAGALTIDTAALGGMYAGNISILATEAGLGVRNQGTWQATGGQIVVTADGLLQNLGSISAGVASLATVKGHIENAGSIQGSQAVVASSGGDTRLFGAGLRQTAGSAVVISAKGAVNLFNNASFGAAQVTSTAAGGQVSINAGQNINVNSGTAIAANKDVQLSSDAMVLASGASVTSASGNVTALAGTGLGISNSTVTGQQVHLETGAAFKDTAAALAVTGGTVRGATQTTLLSTDSIQISNPGTTAVSGGGNVHIQAAKAVDITAGTSVAAGQHMSVMAGTALNLQAASGTTTTHGQKVNLSATGNMLVTGNTITATGSNLSAGQDLSIEANDGNANLHALSNAGGASVDRISLSAGKDLNVSVFKGSLFATGLQAIGQNINLLSNGTTSLAHATLRSGNNTQALASTLTAREDLTVGSINTNAGASSQVQVVASSLSAAGQARIVSNGLALITAATDTVNGVNSPARSSITAGSVAIQGGTVQTDAADIRTNGNKSTASRSGNISVTATSGSALFNVHTNNRSQFNSTGNIALHAHGNLTHWHTQANAGGGLSSTSATGQITSTGGHMVAKDVLSFASKGAQTHTNGFYSGGASSVFNETGHLALSSTRVQGVGTTTTGLGAVSGQTSIESGGTLGLDVNSVLVGSTDLSIVQGQGDITIHPDNAARGTLAWSQIGANRNLTLGTRNGNMTITGSAGSNGYGSTQRSLRRFNGDLNLVASNVTLQGSVLQTPNGNLNITATTGNVKVDALKADKSEAGFVNTYWDMAQLQGRNVTVRAAGNVDLSTVFASASNQLTIESGGHLTTSGNYIRWQVDNRPSNGWYQDEHHVARTTLEGANGVRLGALGGTLTLNATDVRAASGTASLQALGHIRLEASEEHMLHQASSTRTERGWFGLKKKVFTTHWHNEYLSADPVTIAARDIALKAGNNIQTFGTQFNASGNLHLEAGEQIHYFAVQNQEIKDVTTHKRSSFVGIKYNSATSTSTRSLTSALPTVMQSQGDILSNSGGNQLLQGTRVSYGGAAAFNAGVGERARADARIILEGIRTTTTQSRTSQSNYVVWQRQINQGSIGETLNLPSFTGPSKPIFTAPGGLSVQIPSGDFTSQINTLSRQPGMGYLNELTQRRDVDWQRVKLAHDQWDFKQEGLTPAGAVLVAVAVAWATGGMGASMMGTTGTATSAMANAAFSSLAAQASVSLIKNKGDVAKTLKDLGSSQTVKATIAAALTAGVLDGLNASSAEMRTISNNIKNGSAGLSEKLTFSLINASGRALTNTAINGGNLEDALRQALIGGLVDTAHGQAASQIKGLESQYLAHKLAHALAGCVAGAAASGTCKDGAIGAAIGEIIAGPGGLLKPKNGMFYTEEEKRNVLAITKLVGGAVSAYSGGNAQTAITTAETAVSNNAFFVPALVVLMMGGGYSTYVGDGNPLTGLQQVGQGNDPLSKAMVNGTAAVVDMSMQRFPAETTATLNFLNSVAEPVGRAVNATVTYLDDNTGRVVSTQWNNLSPATRDALIGAGKITSVAISAGGVGTIRTALTNPRGVDWSPNISTRGASWEKHLGDGKFKDYVSLNELQSNHKAFDFFDPSTGHAVSAKTMDTLGLTNQAGTPMTATNAERYLRNYINDAKSYKPPPNQKNAIPADDIKSKSVELAIPHGTPANVRQALERVAAYGRAEGVQVRITVVRK